MPVRSKKNLASFCVGNRVRIKESQHSPYAGHSGVVSSVDLTDERGPYLVRFEVGMQFRYKAEEVELAHSPASAHIVDKIMKSGLYRILSVAVRQVLSPGNTQPRFDSVPPRFGTRQ